MIRKGIHHAARFVLGAKNRRKQADPSLVSVLAQAINLVEDAAEWSALSPQGQATLLPSLKKASHNLRQQVAAFVDGAGGPTAELSDALRVLFRPGVEHAGVPELLERLLPKGEMAWFANIVHQGDSVLLARLIQEAESHHGHTETLQALSEQMAHLAAAAVDPELSHAATAAMQRLLPPQLPPLEQDLLELRFDDAEAPSTSAAVQIHQRLPTPAPVPTPPPAKVAPLQEAPPLPPQAALVSVLRPTRGGSATPSSSASFFDIEQGFIMGQKSPVPMLGTVRKNNSDKALYSQLYAAHDFWDLLITHTIFTGGFGKVRWGINYNLETFAIKEFRAFDAKYPPFSQMSAHEVALRQKKTKLTPDTKVLEEARLTQRLRDAIEAYCKPYDNPFEDQNNSLCQVRERIHPFVIHTMIELPAKDNVKKVHMVMSRESGDLFEAVRILPKRVLPALALSLAAQGFTELAAMHDAAKYIHLDIKLENVLFHHDGQFKLMDFGLAQDISAQDSFSVRSMYGTLHAPEMFATDNPHLPERRNLSSATDVFCLALTIVDAAGLKQQNPFVFTSGGNSAKKAWKRAADVQQEFKNFRQNLLDKKGKINVAAIRAGTTMGDYFFALAKNNPDLCKLLLEQALVPNPALRSPARIVARNIRRLLAEPKAPNFAELRAELRKIAESNEDILALKHAAHQAMAAPS